MRYIAVVLCVTMTIVCAHAQDAGVLKLPQDMEFKGPLSGPPQTVVLCGDPTKPGLFVTRVKFSTGWKDAPHWHPEEVRTVAVLSGTFYFGRGEIWDESKFTAYPAGRSTLNLRRPRTLRGQRTVTLLYKSPVLARRVRHLSSLRTDSAA